MDGACEGNKEAEIALQRKHRLGRRLRQRLGVGERHADIEHRVHHAGHGGGGAGAHADEKRVGSIAETPLNLALDDGHRPINVALQWLTQTFAQVRLTLAGLDGETRGHRQAEFVAHEPQTETLATKARAQPRMGLAVPEIEKRDCWRRFQKPVSLARHRRALPASTSSN